MNQRSTWALFSWTLVAVMASGSVARAESSGVPCHEYAQLYPRPAVSLPANAPALVFEPANTVAAHPIEDYGLGLVSSDGNAVPAALYPEGSLFLVQPAAVLPVGPLQVKYRDLCAPYPTAVEPTTATLTVVPSVPLPTALGEVTVRPTANLLDPNAACLSARVRIGIDVRATPELAAFVGVTRWRVTRAGTTADISYGYFESSDGVVSLGFDDVCAPGQERLLGQVTIAAHVAGATVDPPAVVAEVSALCPGAGAANALPACLSDSGVPPAEFPDAGATSDVAPLRADEAAPGRGCAVGGAEATTGSALFAGLMFLRAIGPRRRTKGRA